VLPNSSGRIPAAHVIDAERSFDGEPSGTHLECRKAEPARLIGVAKPAPPGFALWAWVAQEDDMSWIALPHVALGPSGFVHLREALQVWRRRDRERSELARMTESELHDIGVTSAERWAEINKPCWRG
jgi:uncharacterized protein YjiS (DUF1127 family)